jgi:hypothetical protein
MRRLGLAAVVACLLTMVGASTAPAANEAGFKTAKPPYLVPMVPGVVVDPIISAGDIVGGYQMTGIPDGLGAFKMGGDTLGVAMNHELGISFPGIPPGVDTRISKLTINRTTHGVLAGSYLFTGTEGFERFCSATLEEIMGTPYYLTGEESLTGSPTGHNGSSIVMNAETGQWTETPQFGHFEHENVVPVMGFKKFVLVSTEDNFRVGVPSYLYAYIADSFEDAVAGNGSLYVWKALNPADTAFTMAKGDTVSGEFVSITQAENANDVTLKTAATSKGAFRFARLEDAAVAYQKSGRLYFSDTGKPGEATLAGRIYRFDIDPSDPTQASVTLLLDSTVDDMANPDNLGTSPQSLMIQEDRENPFRVQYGRILRYDLNDGSLTPVARVNTLVGLPGQWESSGIIWAGNLLGGGWWLADVQAHTLTAPQPGPTLVPNSSVGEDGQLDALFVPSS